MTQQLPGWSPAPLFAPARAGLWMAILAVPFLALVALGTLHLALVLGVIMPFFSPTSAPVMLGSNWVN